MEITVRTHPESGLVVLGTTALPRRYTVEVEETALPSVRIHVLTEPDMSQTVESVTVAHRAGADPINQLTLRKLTLGRWLREARSQVAGRLTDWTIAGGDTPLWHPPPRGSGHVLTDEHYQQVAAIYREATAAGRSGLREVAVRLHGSKASAARWIKTTREKGFLEAGEVRQDGGNDGE